MKQYSLYLFDFDGCLVDTYYALDYVFRKSFLEFGIEITFEEVVQFCRQPLPVSFKQKGGKDEDFKKFNYFIDLYLDYDESIKRSVIFPETIDMLKGLINKGKPIGIVTSNNIPHVKRILDFFKIDSNMFSVFVGNECKKHKPNPEPILSALEKLDFKGDKSSVVYVGDALDDMKAAEGAGVSKILIDRVDYYREYKDIKIKNLLELLDE